MCTLPGRCIMFDYKSLWAGTTTLPDCLRFCLVHFCQVPSLFSRPTWALQSLQASTMLNTQIGKHRQLSESTGLADTVRPEQMQGCNHMQSNHATHGSLSLYSSYMPYWIISFTQPKKQQKNPCKPRWPGERMIYIGLDQRHVCLRGLCSVHSSIFYIHRRFFLFASWDTDCLSQSHYSTSSLCLTQV